MCRYYFAARRASDMEAARVGRAADASSAAEGGYPAPREHVGAGPKARPLELAAVGRAASETRESGRD